MSLRQNHGGLGPMTHRVSQVPGRQGLAALGHTQNPVGTMQGGANAKGTPGRGFFQFGDNQYGFAPGNGGTPDFGITAQQYNAYAAKHPQGILPAASVPQTGMPAPKARPPYYLDEIYARNMVQPTFDNKQLHAQVGALPTGPNGAGGSGQLGDLANQYDSFVRDTNTKMGQDRVNTGADVAARGFDPSGGAGAAPILDLVSQAVNSIGDATLKRDNQVSDLKGQLGNADEQLVTNRAAEQELSKARYAAAGKTPPKLPKGYHLDNGVPKFTNKNGVTVTVARKAPKGKK